MAVWYNWVTWGVFGFLAAASLLVLLERTETRVGAWLRPRARAALERLTGDDLRWLDWRPALVLGAVVFASVVAFGVTSGAYGCHPPGISDQVGAVSSGTAFWNGHDPFTVPDCGGTIQVPYGLAAVLIDAVGSLGGIAGVYALWGAMAVTILPLVWRLAGSERHHVLLYVGSSVLLVPIVSSQIDGVTNAIVPFTVLLSLVLAERHELLAAAVGGFLSSARFPNLFPVLGATGTNRRRYLAFATAVLCFGAATAVAYAVWGSAFLGPVFLNQVGRRSFSLNLYGVFLLANALPASVALEAAQAALTLALVVAVFYRFRSPIRSAAVVLVGLALLTPFLSFSIMVWLLPVALVGLRARWWLWGIGAIGSVNYDLALNVWAWDDGVTWPSAVLDVTLTVLLLALFVELWRADDPPAPATPSARRRRHVEPHLVAVHEPETGVDRPAERRGVQEDPTVAARMGPVDHRAHEGRGHPPAARLGLGVHREQVGHRRAGEATRTGLAGLQPERAAPEDAAVLALGHEGEQASRLPLPHEPASVGGVGALELPPRPAADLLEHPVPVAHQGRKFGRFGPADAKRCDASGDRSPPVHAGRRGHPPPTRAA